MLEVSDRGPGIPADEREQAFEPFERLGHDTDVPGTGLGLTVVAGVVARKRRHRPNPRQPGRRHDRSNRVPAGAVGHQRPAGDASS